MFPYWCFLPQVCSFKDLILFKLAFHYDPDTVILCQQWGLFDRQFGRSDAEQPDPEGRVPVWEKASVQEMKDKFKAVGFGPRQVIPRSRFHQSLSYVFNLCKKTLHGALKL